MSTEVSLCIMKLYSSGGLGTLQLTRDIYGSGERVLGWSRLKFSRSRTTRDGSITALSSSPFIQICLYFPIQKHVSSRNQWRVQNLWLRSNSPFGFNNTKILQTCCFENVPKSFKIFLRSSLMAGNIYIYIQILSKGLATVIFTHERQFVGRTSFCELGRRMRDSPTGNYFNNPLSDHRFTW